MLKQGCMSTVKVVGDRLFKSINKVNIEGTIIPLYEEYKILKYVQNLGPEFPQNVKCEGPLSLSYDYKHGITLKSYLKNELSPDVRKDLSLQFVVIYYKLINKGIYHEDYNYRNFIVNDKLHIIDFGMINVQGRKMIGIDQRNIPIGANFDDYPEPMEDYRDVYIYQYDELESIKRLIRLNSRNNGLMKDINMDQVNNSKTMDEIINIFKNEI